MAAEPKAQAPRAIPPTPPKARRPTPRAARPNVPPTAIAPRPTVAAPRPIRPRRPPRPMPPAMSARAPMPFAALRLRAILNRALGRDNRFFAIPITPPAIRVMRPNRPPFFSSFFPLRASSLAFCAASRSSRRFFRRSLNHCEEPSRIPSPSMSPRMVLGLRSRIPSRISSSNRIWYSPMTSIISEEPPPPPIPAFLRPPLTIPIKPPAPFLRAPNPLPNMLFAEPMARRPIRKAPPTKDLAPLHRAPLRVVNFLPAMSTKP
ncbi:hypothetical protein D3C78_1109730 [compost metagenome]